MSTSIKPIETEYAGIMFRSRLEARWAMLFDGLGIRWEYEAEAYRGESWTDAPPFTYLPDFWLPEYGYWCEVKGDPTSVSSDYLAMLGAVGHFMPGVHNSHGESGVILLGQIPRVDAFSGLPGYTVVSHYKGCSLHVGVFVRGDFAVVGDRWFDFKTHRASCCEEGDLQIVGAAQLWSHARMATNPDKEASVRDVCRVYESVRSHRFWNPR